MPDHQVQFRTNSEAFSVRCDDNTPLLTALLTSGQPLRKPCRNGVCGLCRCQLLAGEITYEWRVPHGLWQKDIDEGYILPCIARARSDLELGKVDIG